MSGHDTDKTRSRAARGLSALFSATMVFIMAACSTGSSLLVPPKQILIKGYVVDGPIAGATVQAYTFAKGIRGALLGSTQTNNEGFYTLRLPRGSDSTIMLEAGSGFYVEDASDQSAVVTLGTRQNLRALASIRLDSTNWVQLTPYTLLATGLAQFKLAELLKKSNATAAGPSKNPPQPAELTPEQVSNTIRDANAAISQLIGDIDVLTTSPLRATAGGMSDTNMGSGMPHTMSMHPNLDSHVYSLFNGALSFYAKYIGEQSNAAAFSSFTSIGLAQLMYKDIADDGILDGLALDDDGNVRQLMFGAERLGSTNYRKFLGEGMLQLADARQAEGVAPFEQVMHKAHYFAESQDGLWGTGEPLPFDNEPPSVHAFARVGYDKSTGIVRYHIDATDPVGVHSLAVSIDGKSTPENAIMGDHMVELHLDAVGAGEHVATVTATDVLGNSGTTNFNIIMPDGKPVATLTSPRVKNTAAYTARGEFIDDTDAGIAALTLTVKGIATNATLDYAKGLWSAALTLAEGDNTLTLRITDNQGQFRETVHHVTIDTQKPTYTLQTSGAEFFNGASKYTAQLSDANGGGDPLYISAARIGFPNPMAEIAELADKRIPYLIIDARDNLPNATLTMTMKYSVNGQVKTAPRAMRPAVIDQTNTSARFVIPLIREVLTEKWYQVEPTDIHTIDLTLNDVAGNTVSYTLTFKAFFDLPIMHVHSNVKGAMVHAHEYGSGAAGGQIGGCTTNDRGECTLRVFPEAMFAHFMLMDGAYLEPATGVAAPLKMGEILSSVIDFQGKDIDVAITPYSHQATGLLEHAFAVSGDVKQAYQKAVDDARDAYRFDVFTTVPDDPVSLNLATSAYSSETRYALLLGALSNWTATLNVQQGYAPHTQYTSVGAAQTFYTDALADGLLDGKGINDKGTPFMLNFGNTMLDANTYRHDLALHVALYAGKLYTLSATERDRVLQLAQDVAGNTSPLYGKAPVVNIDNRLPVISLLSPNTTRVAGYRAIVRVAPGVTPISRVTINGVNATATGSDWSADLTWTTLGRNMLNVRAYSPTGSEIHSVAFYVIWDNIAPLLHIDTPSSLTNLSSTTAEFMLEGTATDSSGIARVTVRVGAKSWDVTSEHWMAHVELAPGTNSVTVEATDAIGNTATQQFSVNFVPKITLDPAPPARTTGDKPQFRGTVEGTGMNYTLRATLYLSQNLAWVALNTTPVNIIANANGVWTLDFFTTNTLKPLISGQYKLTLTVTSGGITSSSDVLFVVDRTPPNITPISPLSNTRENPYTLVFEVKDDSGTVTSVSVNGNAATPQANSRWAYTAPKQASDGTVVYNIVARDDLANTATATHNVTLDSVGPSLVITQPADNAWVTTPGVALVISTSDPTLPITNTVTIEGVTVTPNAMGEYALQKDGANTIVVSSADGVGNTTSRTLTINRDATPPAIVTNPATLTPFTQASSVNLTVSATDALSVPALTVKNNNVAVGTVSVNGNTATWSGSSIALIEGTNTITISAQDARGNVSATKTLTVVRDTTLPVVTVGNTFATNSSTFNLTGSTVDSSPATMVATSSGGATFSANYTSGQAWNIALTGLSVGTNTFNLVANDQVGNSSAPITITILMEAIAPTVTNANTGTYASTSSTAYSVITNQNAVKVNAVDEVGGSGIKNVIFGGGGSTTARTVTGGTAGVYTDTYTKTASGTYSYTVTATDNAGNTSPAVTVTYIYDITLPTISMSSSFTSNSSSYAVKGTTTESNPNQITITATNTGQKGKQWTTAYTNGTQWSLTVTGLTTGTNTFSVVASDKAGNVSSTKSISIRR